jgi:uncharacterized protein (TIGR03086 family)
MDDLIALHRRAVQEFDARVRAVGDDQWALPTPCADWDVRALVNHVVGEDRWTAPLLDGMTVAEVGDRFDGDLLGDEPRRAWAEAAAEATAAVAAQGVLTRIVHVSFGDITGAEYISQLTADHVIHAWDLARGIGADERLDPDLVAFAHDTLAPQVEAWRAGGAFGPAVEVPEGSDLQARLIALTGRQP